MVTRYGGPKQDIRWHAKRRRRQRRSGALGRKLTDWQRAIRWAHGLTRTERLIALEHLDYYSAEKFEELGKFIVWPSVPTISRNLGIPVPTVRSARAQLVKSGMIVRVSASQYGRVATYLTTSFLFDDAWLAAHPHERGTPLAPQHLLPAIGKDKSTATISSNDCVEEPCRTTTHIQ